jgi:DNA replication protein DnaC
MSKHLENSKQPNERGVDEYECHQCEDRGYIFYKNEQGYDVARECSCLEQKRLRARFKNALIPEEFKNARFDNYVQKSDVQKRLYHATIEYLKNFKTSSHKYNLGFIAVFGEQRIRELPSSQRAEAKARHNNFGLGKTHLQIAAAKWLMKQGYSTLVVSDIAFMDELVQAKRIDDEGETLARLLWSANRVDVLIWDDIGKAKWSETKENFYYQIINERYKNQKPILFSSNEDKGTLSEKIGFAAASRLFGMCGPYLLEVEGEDFRLKGGVRT